MIDARRSKPKLMVSAIGTINSTLKASSTIAHPLMVRLFERFEHVGLEQALTEMKRGEDGEAFCEVWQAYRDERRCGDAPMGASKTPLPLWCSPARLTLIVKWPALPFSRGIPTASSPFSSHRLPDTRLSVSELLMQIALLGIAIGANALSALAGGCLLYTSPSPRDYAAPRMPSSA